MWSVKNEAESFESAAVAAEPGANGDRVQRASISRAHAGLSDNMAPLVLLCTAAQAPAPAGAAKRRQALLVNETSFLHAVLIVDRAATRHGRQS